MKDQTEASSAATTGSESTGSEATGSGLTGSESVDREQSVELIPADQPAAGGPAGTPFDRGGRPALIAAFAVGAGLFLLAVGYLVDLLATSGAIERNTTIAGVQVGGMTPEQATAALTDIAAPGYTEPITIDVHGEATSIDPAVAGLTFSVAESVRAAGIRSANPFVRLTSFFSSSAVPMSVQVNYPAVTAALAQMAAATDRQSVEGAVAIDGVTVRTVEPVVGRSLQVPEATSALVRAWESGGPAAVRDLVLPVTSSAVRANPDQVAAAAAEASAILSAPLQLTGPDATVEFSMPAIAGAMTITPDDADGFVVGINVPGVRSQYTAAVEATQTAPADAAISIVDDRPVLAPAVPGRTVDWTATEAAIEAGLRGSHAAAIGYVMTQPTLTTEAAAALGITEVIGEFTTGGFAAASGENIRVVAAKVNGAIVQPGATFGLNEFTGPRGTDQGYVPAAIIQEGALATAVGGGISQFATTLYNAAYFAGLGDVTHTPHSFYISRYPPGREATVFDGEIELAFSNDYPTGVLIQTVWTSDDITVRLWGTKQVTVESVTTDRFDFTSPQVVVKPFGQSCSPSSGSSGFSVVNTRIIRDLGGAEIRREDFTTVYNGQQNVVCSPPPAATTADPAATDAVTAGG